MSSNPFSLGTRILAGAAGFLLILLLIGFLLPGRWDSTAQIEVAASAPEVFAYLDSPTGWQAWTPWPDSTRVDPSPEVGAGASMSWSDREMGSGTFRIVEVVWPTRVRYAVSVQDGAILTDGEITLSSAPAGVHVEWHEVGDFGWNPLMGYWALAMSKAQAREMQKSLDRLAALVTGADARTDAEAPADTGSTGAI